MVVEEAPPELTPRLLRALHEVLRKVETVDTTLHDHKTLNCWQDVADAIERAKEVDSNKAKNSPLRAGFRKAKPEIVLLESLTAMIPDETGLSVLRGGLTTLCKVSTTALDVLTSAMLSNCPRWQSCAWSCARPS